LTADDIPCPSAADPDRNRHRSGIAWSKSAIRAILTNPRYTGRQVWNRQRKQEMLLDINDVALGHETKLRWNSPDAWVWSDRPAHPAIVDDETFQRVRSRLASRGPASSGRTVVRTRHPYTLRGLLVCAACGRRMQGSWNHDQAHYRCVVATEYALANNSDHPKALYLRESAVLPEPDRWIAPGPKTGEAAPPGGGREGRPRRQRCLDKSLAEQLDRPSTPRSYAS